MRTKKCKICQEIKPVDEFGLGANNKDGFASYCKKCHNIKKSKKKGIEWAVAGYRSEREHFNATLEYLSNFIPDFVEDKEATKQRILNHRKPSIDLFDKNGKEIPYPQKKETTNTTNFNTPLKQIESNIKDLTDIEHDIVKFLSSVNLSAMDIITANEHQLIKYVNATFQQRREDYIETYGNMEDALIEIYQSTFTLVEKLQKQLIEDTSK